MCHVLCLATVSPRRSITFDTKHFVLTPPLYHNVLFSISIMKPTWCIIIIHCLHSLLSNAFFIIAPMCTTILDLFTTKEVYAVCPLKNPFLYSMLPIIDTQMGEAILVEGWYRTWKWFGRSSYSPCAESWSRRQRAVEIRARSHSNVSKTSA